MYRITLRIPEDLAKKIEEYAQKNAVTPTKQHAYRLFLEEGFNTITGNKSKHYEKLSEISAALALENRYYLRQLYRINFDAKKSKFDEPESEFNYARKEMKEFIKSVLKDTKSSEKNDENNED